jgi:predicted secreted protein
MAIAAYPATVKIGANTIQDIMTIELNVKMETAETTAFGGSGGAAVGTKTFVPTLVTGTAKLIGSWNKADSTGQLLLENAFFARTTVTVIFSPNGTNTYTGAFWVTDYPIKADPKKQVDAEYSLLLNGALTLA